MAELVAQPLILAGDGWGDYGLVDSGHGRKLERYGPYRFVRPEPQAMWSPRLAEWDAAGEFVPGSDEDGGGRWHFAQVVPGDGWPLVWNDVRFTAQCTPFRHLGFFPDMAPVWEWMGKQYRHPGLDPGPLPSSMQASDQRPAVPGRARDDGFSSLNLFGYTGVGSLALSAQGPVTHVDASKKSVAQARANAELSGMVDRPIRWLVDDAAKFTAREVRRGPSSGAGRKARSGGWKSICLASSPIAASCSMAKAGSCS
jgi:23S rRNA (cytosine1962-C5)-methyltransferase